MSDADSLEDCIRKEAIEESGYEMGKVEKLYMSPGGVTEVLYFFAAEYNELLHTNTGGGVMMRISMYCGYWLALILLCEFPLVESLLN